MTSARARLILNPAAGRDAAAGQALLINSRLRDRYESLEIVLTVAAGDCEAAARRAVEDGCEHLFIGGGDGTLNEALNGVASVDGGLARTVFGLLPLGTGNDFARALGIPTETEPALEVVLGGRTLPVDVGTVNGRCFVNVSAGGFMAEVSEAVTPQMKSLAGRLAYLVGGAQTLLEFEPVGLTLTSEPGAAHIEMGMYAFAVCNSRLVGGGRLIAPHAIVDDGLLDICVIDAMPTMEFVGLLRQVSTGGHVEDPRVHYVQASRATLSFDRSVRLNTDGEVLEARTCEYGILPRAATFFAGEAPFSTGE
jgi:diacylglycerol kinase (ATP)